MPEMVTRKKNIDWTEGKTVISSVTVFFCMTMCLLYLSTHHEQGDFRSVSWMNTWERKMMSSKHGSGDKHIVSVDEPAGQATGDVWIEAASQHVGKPILPKVALLFFTPGHELTWRNFFLEAATLSCSSSASEVVKSAGANSGKRAFQRSCGLNRASRTANSLAHQLSQTLPTHLRQAVTKGQGPAFNLTKYLGHPLYPAIPKLPHEQYPWVQIQSHFYSKNNGKCVNSQSDACDQDVTLRDLLDKTQQSEQAQILQELNYMVNLDDPNSVIRNQDLFNVYVYAPPEPKVLEHSIFRDYVIKTDHDTCYGYRQSSVLEAMQLLFKEALKDPGNVRFVLVSEVSIPIKPPAVIWAQLLSENKSRSDACRPRTREWWPTEFETDYLKKSHWRKSSQWTSLTRAHAEIVGQDEHVFEMFSQNCWVDVDGLKVKSSWQHGGSGTADEHGIPTVLGLYNQDDQTDCKGSLSHVDWSTRTSHPRTFFPRSLTTDLAEQVHFNAWDRPPKCDIAATTHALFSTLQALSMRSAGAGGAPSIVHTAAWKQVAGDAQLGDVDASIDAHVSQWARRVLGDASLPSTCTMFARKFAYSPESYNRSRAVFGDAAVLQLLASSNTTLTQTLMDGHIDAGSAVLHWSLSCSYGLGLGWWCPAR